MSSIVIVVVALGALGWLAFLVASGMRGRSSNEIAPNLDPYKTDDELENRRLDRVLSVSVILSAVLAISIPVYWLGEIDRQEGFVHQFEEEGLERGLEHVEEFACASCHGPDLVGGAAGYVDKRSGVTVAWTAPALNDITYRYDDEEITFWLVYGRPNSPMPAWGTDGGGPMNEQQIDEVLEYLKSIQISQEEALAQVNGRVSAALGELAEADARVEGSIEAQMALLQEIDDAPGFLAVLEPLAASGRSALDAAGEGIDTDEDGVSDTAEAAITAITTEAAATGYPGLAAILADVENPDTLGTGEGDLVLVSGAVAKLEEEVNGLTLTVERADVLREQAEAGLEFLLAAQENRDYAVDLQAVADATFDGNLAEAERAVGLYQSYCARCHTAGYSSGPAYTAPIGSGAFGPALWDGRANVQFLTADDMKDFLGKGSEEGVGYGVNGIGRGYMPAFGQVLSEADLDLLIQYLRGERLR